LSKTINLNSVIPRKHENTKTRNSEEFPFLFFRAHAAQAPALRVHHFVFSWLICFSADIERLSKLLEPANSIISVWQENIDFNTLFRYKKASTEIEEAC
jgi:hypothetical protein